MKRSHSIIMLILIISNLNISSVLSQEPNAISDNSSQNTNLFEGLWLREIDSMVLYIADYNVDSFAFVMVSYLSGNYAFLGEGDGGFYKYARINKSTAHFNDSSAYSDGRQLYFEGEEPCELSFSLEGNEKLEVVEKNTCGVYVGHGAYWRGEYRKYSNAKILHDLKEASIGE